MTGLSGACMLPDYTHSRVPLHPFTIHALRIKYASIAVQAREEPGLTVISASPLHGRRPYPHCLRPCRTTPTCRTQLQSCSTHPSLFGTLPSERRKCFRIIEANPPRLRTWMSARRGKSVRDGSDQEFSTPTQRKRCVASCSSDHKSLTSWL